MKIAFFMVPLLNHGGGAEKSFITFANGMARRGHKVGIVNLSKSFYKSLAAALSLYYMHRSFPMRLTDREVESMLFESVEWLRVGFKSLKRNLQKFEVIYSKNEILDLGVLRLVGFKNISPVIVGIHTPIYYRITSSLHSEFHNFLYSDFFYRDLIKSCTAVHVTNLNDKTLVEERYPQLAPKIYKICLPLDTDKFRPMKSEDKQNEKFKVLFAARLTEKKGVDILAKVIRKLSLEPIFESLNFTIAGSGELEKKVRNLGRKFKNVHYLGHVVQDEMPVAYSSNDILIAPFRNEPMSWVGLEAQSCGLPVIVSGVSGPQDMIIDGETGFIVKNKPENFVEQIKYFYNLKKKDRTKFSHFGTKAREHIIKKFDPNLVFDKLEKMLEEGRI